MHELRYRGRFESARRVASTGARHLKTGARRLSRSVRRQFRDVRGKVNENVKTFLKKATRQTGSGLTKLAHKANTCKYTAIASPDVTAIFIGEIMQKIGQNISCANTTSGTHVEDVHRDIANMVAAIIHDRVKDDEFCELMKKSIRQFINPDYIASSIGRKVSIILSYLGESYFDNVINEISVRLNHYTTNDDASKRIEDMDRLMRSVKRMALRDDGATGLELFISIIELCALSVSKTITQGFALLDPGLVGKVLYELGQRLRTPSMFDNWTDATAVLISNKLKKKLNERQMSDYYFKEDERCVRASLIEGQISRVLGTAL